MEGRLTAASRNDARSPQASGSPERMLLIDGVGGVGLGGGTLVQERRKR